MSSDLITPCTLCCVAAAGAVSVCGILRAVPHGPYEPGAARPASPAGQRTGAALQVQRQALAAAHAALGGTRPGELLCVLGLWGWGWGWGWAACPTAGVVQQQWRLAGDRHPYPSDEFPHPKAYDSCLTILSLPLEQSSRYETCRPGNGLTSWCVNTRRPAFAVCRPKSLS